MTEPRRPDFVARQARQATNRQRLIDAAHALFSSAGYEGVSVTAIARAAGLTTGAIFASFAGKEDLYRVAMGCAPLTAADCHALQLVLPRVQGLLERIAGQTNDAEAFALLADLRSILHPSVGGEPSRQFAQANSEAPGDGLPD